MMVVNSVCSCSVTDVVPILLANVVLSILMYILYPFAIYYRLDIRPFLLTVLHPVGNRFDL
jgi:hypothetical protein